ncbi:hypothetical protein L9F63_014343, partial [Diploptera punctata]
LLIIILMWCKNVNLKTYEGPKERNNRTVKALTSSQIIQERIVRGKRAKRGMFPYVVGLSTVFNKKGDLLLSICTGSIITTRWILSAAHCVSGENVIVEKVSYSVGEIDIRKKLRDILLFIIHPQYSYKKTNGGVNVIYDLSLLKTEKEIKYNNFINRVCMSRDLDVSGKCFAVGYGSLDNIHKEHALPNEILYYATLEYKVFHKIYPGILHIELDERYPSSGDSGGPLMCKGMLVGVCSMGATEGREAVMFYTAVDCFANWIEETIKDK